MNQKITFKKYLKSVIEMKLLKKKKKENNKLKNLNNKENKKNKSLKIVLKYQFIIKVSQK